MNDRLISELMLEVQRFCDARNWAQFHGPKELAIGITTESAELLDLFRFKSEKESFDILKDKNLRRRIEDELADILFFVLRFAQLYQISIPSALSRKLAANRKKYPIRLVKGKNCKYSEYSR
jgi:NTP pyrophosphatase (non-canonical NTP hydrolase)